MIELEIKAKSNKKTEQKIKEKANFIEKKHQKDIYLNHPVRDFSETDEALRIRKVNQETYLTYKGPKIEEKTKTRKEIEEKVESYRKTKEIMKSLGFKEAGTIEKTRETYEINDYKITIDEVNGLGRYIELEKEVKELKQEEIKEALNYLKKLGLKDEDFERKSYLELKLKKEKND